MSKTKTRPSRPQPAVTEQDQDKDREVVLDLASFVNQVERFSCLIEPFAFLFYCIDDIRRWRFPNPTIAAWVIVNICCFVLTQGAVFVLASCVVIAVATISLCQVHTRILDKYMPQTKSEAVKPITEETNTLETVQNFQFSLIQMHDFIVKSNEYITYIFAVLKWDDTVPALIYHTEVCISMLCVVVFPVRWNCFCLINWFFLCHPVILKKGCSHWVNLMESVTKTSDQNNGSVTSAASRSQSSASAATTSGSTSLSTQSASAASAPASHSPTSSVKNKASADLDSLDGDEKDDSDVDLIEMTTSVDESLSKIEPAPQRPGMVARLLELKKRRAQMANENCFGCRVSFSSILKRRHYCRHCGNSFCHKCCNQKLPRSVFGATSPAASKETVLVCNTCHGQLATTTGDTTLSQGQKPRSETT